jgi:hypothetical protein
MFALVISKVFLFTRSFNKPIPTAFVSVFHFHRLAKPLDTFCDMPFLDKRFSSIFSIVLDIPANLLGELTRITSQAIR